MSCMFNAGGKLLREMLTSMSPTWTCHICSKEFTNPSTLEIHKKIHSFRFNSSLSPRPGAVESSFNYPSSSSSEPNHHQSTPTNSSTSKEMAHSGKQITQMSLGELPREQIVNRKINSLVDESERPFSCSHCSHRAQSKTNIRRHFISRHTNNRPFHCPKCEYSGKLKSGLTAHLKIHTNERTELCPYPGCFFKFSFIRDLKAHVGEHQILEKVCGSNILRIPEGIVFDFHQLKCMEPNCDHVTASMENMIAHMVAHYEEKKLSCQLCSFRAKHQTSLKNHLLKTHGQDERPIA